MPHTLRLHLHPPIEGTTSRELPWTTFRTNLLKGRVRYPRSAVRTGMENRTQQGRYLPRSIPHRRDANHSIQQLCHASGHPQYLPPYVQVPRKGLHIGSVIGFSGPPLSFSTAWRPHLTGLDWCRGLVGRTSADGPGGALVLGRSPAFAHHITSLSSLI